MLIVESIAVSYEINKNEIYSSIIVEKKHNNSKGDDLTAKELKKKF